MKHTLLAITFGAALVVGVVSATAANAHGRSAMAALATADGRSIGTVEFRNGHGRSEVRVRLAGAPGVNAFHGFHIHANDVDTNGDGCVADPAAGPATWFVSADGHYNPTGQSHSHHLGDLPVVYVTDNGTVETRFEIDEIKIADLDRKIVILHAGADNYANIPLGTSPTQYSANSTDATVATAKTGNAGDRIACGVITSR
ncbi:MAG: superoxide dismutase family protein [Ilumatobacteraceae bacterium]